MADHTPGPWRQDCEGSLVVIAGDGKDQRIVAGVWGHVAESEWPIEGAANAHLIAAAPEMYELLESLHADLSRYSKMTEEVWSSGSIAFSSMADSVHAVLAKARGEANRAAG